MPVVLGFELNEMRFSAFSFKSLMSTTPYYPWRRSRVIWYQIGMLIGLSAECTATYSLAKYQDLQDHIEGWFPGAHLYNNDIVDMSIVTIVFGVLTAFLFGADFFFLALFPKRLYPHWYDVFRCSFAVVICAGMFAAALGSTIVVAAHNAKLSGVSMDDVLKIYPHPTMNYVDWGVNIAWIVQSWIAWAGVSVS
ncbi:hypothetical protein CYLTODRAFT_412971 [Cylindrobasidium torrendii FP15055 ss-10]|uniref:Uncharacterized protein n=1 Tax=Cylindrobasidium torrendii FP15055 ss-10 TaxID=1314674 RepID=A0A0D7B3W3_9AGAR|nr:hypothetical protein CYLTODRAFT_412971 [Cylindrobasidium torrendii FP15055 ss-10]